MCVHIETISIPIAYVSPQSLHTNLCLLVELKQSAYTTPSCGVGVVASVGVGAVVGVGAGAGLDLVADRRRRTRTRDQDQACVGTTSKVEETTRGSPYRQTRRQVLIAKPRFYFYFFQILYLLYVY